MQNFDFVLKHYHVIEASSIEVQLDLLPAMLASLPEKPILSTSSLELSPAQRICKSEVRTNPAITSNKCN